jgi:hypothetical protein
MYKKPSEAEFQFVAFAPQDAANIALDKAKELRDMAYKGIEFPIPEIASYPFAPLLPGQLCVVLAQSSNYKSGFMDFWKDHVAGQLDLQDRIDEAVFYISVEDMLEEQIFFEQSKETGLPVEEISTGHVQDWNKIIDATVKIGGIQVYRICNSLKYADRENLPELFLSNIEQAIDMVFKRDGKKPAVIFIDYLQALPLDPEHAGFGADSRRLQVRADTYTARRMAAKYTCPVVLGVQAKQKLEGAPGEYMYIPGMYDGEESSSIAQRTDRMISLWLPKQKHGGMLDKQMDHDKISYILRENLLFIKVAKQRGRLPAGKTWPCRIGYLRNKIEACRLEDTYIDKMWNEATEKLNGKGR